MLDLWSSFFDFATGHARLRRSYMDNRIDNLPADPVFFTQRNHGSPSAQDLGRNYHPLYDVEATQDGLIDLLNPIDFQVAQKPHLRSPASDHRTHHQPLDLSSFPLPEDDYMDQDGGLDFSSLLPRKLDVTAPVSERATQEADDIMADFLTFLDLRGKLYYICLFV